MNKLNLKKINDLEKKGLLTKDEYSIYNPLNYPLGHEKERLFKEINESLEILLKKIKEK
jgi:hypothetical protein